MKIPYVSHFIALPIIICTEHAKFQKNKNKKKMYACEAAARGPLLEISYVPLLPVMTPHYRRLYKVSSLEANLSLKDLKQLCRQQPPSQVYLPTPKLIIKPDLF